tara:strand:+ start:1079 stop:1399 length:321 start_codon:yes stop_codon:yes gene_type:complete
MKTLTETQPPSLHASISQMNYDELEYRLHTLNGYSTENTTSYNDSCYSLGVWITKNLYISIYVPNCKNVKDEEDFNTFIARTDEQDLVCETKDIEVLIDRLNALTK